MAPQHSNGSARKTARVNEPRFHQQLGKILDHATTVFCEKGYAGASMRDIGRATGMSLAGMYHYFGTKERLLYLIQKHTFSTILARLRQRLAQTDDTTDAIHAFISNHLEYFLEHQQAMKVLSHEDEALTGHYGREVAEIKREYYHTCRELLNRYKKENGLEFDSRTAVLSLFGMINWIYTWYNPRQDGSANELSTQMSTFFFRGIDGNRDKSIKRTPSRSRKTRMPPIPQNDVPKTLSLA